MGETSDKSKLTDLEKKFKKGDRNSFRELYELCKNRVYSTCLRMLGNTQDAEDAAQETFVKIYKGIGKFRGDSSVHTWIYRIAVNCCIEYIRKRRKDSQLDSLDDPEAKIPIPVESGESLDAKLILEKEIQSLPESSRAIFILHTVEGFKHKEITKILDISEGTSKSQLSAAKERLREQLKPYMEVLRYDL